MSPRIPRVEIVQSDSGWFGRWIASNGREVWRTSEVYTRRSAAQRAVSLLLAVEPVEPRDVDERSK